MFLALDGNPDIKLKKKIVVLVRLILNNFEKVLVMNLGIYSVIL